MRQWIVAALISICTVRSIADDSYGLSFLAEHLDKYCQITTNDKLGCDKKTVVSASSKSTTRPGKQGPRGPPGPPGIVDDDLVNEKITKKIEEYHISLDRIREMERFISNVKKGFCQVIFNEKCFWLIEIKTDYDSAVQLCGEQDGHPANIYGIAHYKMILKHVRGLQDGVTEPWIGMTYDHQLGRARYFNGTLVEYGIPWHPGYPKSSHARAQLNLSIRQELTDIRQGVWNAPPHSVEEGVICEI